MPRGNRNFKDDLLYTILVQTVGWSEKKIGVNDAKRKLHDGVAPICLACRCFAACVELVEEIGRQARRATGCLVCWAVETLWTLYMQTGRHGQGRGVVQSLRQGRLPWRWQLRIFWWPMILSSQPHGKIARILINLSLVCERIVYGQVHQRSRWSLPLVM
jgi:hypothetical protein